MLQILYKIYTQMYIPESIQPTTLRNKKMVNNLYVNNFENFLNKRLWVVVWVKKWECVSVHTSQIATCNGLMHSLIKYEHQSAFFLLYFACLRFIGPPKYLWSSADLCIFNRTHFLTDWLQRNNKLEMVMFFYYALLSDLWDLYLFNCCCGCFVFAQKKMKM